MDKPQQIEWVPLAFAVIAAYIVTLLAFKPAASDAAVQGGIAIATTLAGVAGGAYGSRFQSRPANPTTPAGPAQP